jgi:hypothetical protein
MSSPSAGPQSFSSVRARLESFAASGAVDACDFYDFLCELIPEHVRLLPHDFESAVQHATQHRRINKQQDNNQNNSNKTNNNTGDSKSSNVDTIRPSFARMSSRDRQQQQQHQYSQLHSNLQLTQQQHAALFQPLFLTQSECRSIYSILLQKWQHRLSINTLSQAAYLSIYQPSRLLIALLTLLFWIFLPFIMIWALKSGVYSNNNNNQQTTNATNGSSTRQRPTSTANASRESRKS